jgi:hypothetical protein
MAVRVPLPAGQRRQQRRQLLARQHAVPALHRGWGLDQAGLRGEVAALGGPLQHRAQVAHRGGGALPGGVTIRRHLQLAGGERGERAAQVGGEDHRDPPRGLAPGLQLRAGASAIELEQGRQRADAVPRVAADGARPAALRHRVLALAHAHAQGAGFVAGFGEAHGREHAQREAAHAAVGVAAGQRPCGGAGRGEPEAQARKGGVGEVASAGLPGPGDGRPDRRLG